jgi:hypothetical protein
VRALLGVAGVSGMALLSLSAHADPSNDSRGAAQVLFDRGRELVEHDRFAEACPQFAESQRLDPGIGTLLWLADCYENTGQTASAWAAFSEAAETAAQRHDAREAIARARAAKLEATLSRLTIAVPPEVAAVPDVEIHCDGVLVSDASWGRAVPIDPGSHTITANAPHRRLWWTTIELALGAQGTSVTVPPLAPEDSPLATPAPSEVAARPEEPPQDHARHGMRVTAIAIAAGGLTAIAVGSFFSLKAKAKYDDSNDGPCLPDNHCTPAGLQDRQSASSMATVATIGMTGGVALLAGAGALYIATIKKAPATVAFATTAGGGAVRVDWGW